MRFSRLYGKETRSFWLLLVKVLIVLLAVAAILIWLWYNTHIEALNHQLRQ